VAYRITIREREAEAGRFGSLIKEAFDFPGPVTTWAETEGSPNPDRDPWFIRAQVESDVGVRLRIQPPSERGTVILAYLAIPDPHSENSLSVLREALLGEQEVIHWLSRAWTHLHREEAQRRLQVLKKLA